MDQHTALRKSLDLSHHFSAIARRRQNSPLKEFQKLIGNNPNLISLAGGGYFLAGYAASLII